MPTYLTRLTFSATGAVLAGIGLAAAAHAEEDGPGSLDETIVQLEQPVPTLPTYDKCDLNPSVPECLTLQPGPVYTLDPEIVDLELPGDDDGPGPSDEPTDDSGTGDGPEDEPGSEDPGDDTTGGEDPEDSDTGPVEDPDSATPASGGTSSGGGGEQPGNGGGDSQGSQDGTTGTADDGQDGTTGADDDGKGESTALQDETTAQSATRPADDGGDTTLLLAALAAAAAAVGVGTVAYGTDRRRPKTR